MISNKRELINISVKIPEEMLKKMKLLIALGEFASVSEIVRLGIKIVLKKHQNKLKQANLVAINMRGESV